jgi:recombination protein RecR
MAAIGSLDRLTRCLARLPGIGRRSAERMAMKLVRDRDGLLRDLVAALQQADRDVRCCSRCGALTAVDADPCGTCTSALRDAAVLCVVEDANDVVSLERSGGFNGRYHVLGGKLSPMKGDGPADLRIQSLVGRVREESFREVVLALSTDVEGDSTAHYLSELLEPEGVQVTRLAFGLPAGSGITYSDPVTLAKAMAGRREL